MGVGWDSLDKRAPGGAGIVVAPVARPDCEYERVVGAHTRYFAGMAVDEGQRLRGDGTPYGQRCALETWRIELENVFEALDSALNRQQLEWLLPIARNLQNFLEVRGALNVLEERYGALLDSALLLGSPELQLQAWLGLGRAWFRMRRDSAAEEAARHALELARQLGSREEEGQALHLLGNCASNAGQTEEAARYYDEALQIRREFGDLAGEGSSLNNMGYQEMAEGHFTEASEFLEESLRIHRRIGHRSAEALNTVNLGRAQALQGRYREALELYARGLKIQHDFLLRPNMTVNFALIGHALCALGRHYEGAIALFGARQQAVDIGYGFDPTEQKLWDEGLATLAQAVESRQISAGQLDAWHAEANSLTTAALAAFCLRVIDKILDSEL